MKKIICCLILLALGLFAINLGQKTPVVAAEEVNYSADLSEGIPSDWNLYEKSDVNHTNITKSSNGFTVEHNNTVDVPSLYYGSLIELGEEVSHLSDFTITVKLRFTSYLDKHRWFGIMYHTQYDDNNGLSGYMMCYRVSGETHQSTVSASPSFANSLVVKSTGVPMSDDAFHTVKITCIGSSVTHYIDDKEIVNYDYTDYSSSLPSIQNEGGFALMVNKSSVEFQSIEITSTTDESTPTLGSYLLSETYTNEQGPLWLYKYYDKAAGEYNDLSFVDNYTNTVHWVGDQEVDAWMIPAELGDAYIFAGQTWLPALGYNVVAQFVVPYDGTINIDCIVSRDYPNDWNPEKDIYVRIFKNDGENLLSENSWDTLGYEEQITVDINELSVQEGDVISFELDYGDETNGWPRTFFNPLIDYGQQSEEESNEPILDSYLLSKTYKDKQGPVWYYKYFDKTTNEYGDLTFTKPYTNTIHWVGDQSLDAWKLPGSTGKDGYIFAGQTWLPALNYNIAAQFKVPKDGYLRITFDISRDMPNDWNPEKDIYYRIVLNDGDNLITEKTWETLSCGDCVSIDIDQLQVTTGDIISIELDYGDETNGWPRVYLDPLITYVEKEEEIAGTYSLEKQFSNTQGPVWYYKTYNESSQSYEDLIYDGSVSNTTQRGKNPISEQWSVEDNSKDVLWGGQLAQINDDKIISVIFKAPTTGIVDLSFEITNDVDFNSVQKYETLKETAYVRISKLVDGRPSTNLLDNGKEWSVIYDGYIKYIDLQQIFVTEGEEIAIEFKKNPNVSETSIYFKPVVKYTEATETTEYLSTYNYFNDFATNNSVWKNFYYNKNNDQYNEFDYLGLVLGITRDEYLSYGYKYGITTQDSNYEENQHACTWAGSYICPSVNYESVIAFVAPKTGTVNLNMSSYVYRDSTDGVTLKILKQSQTGITTLRELESLPAMYNETIIINDIDVIKGDYIFIQVGANEELVWDFAYLNPIFGYTFIDPNQPDEEPQDAYTISKVRLSLVKGQQIALADFITPAKGYEIGVGNAFVSNSSVAKIENGNVVAHKEGGTTLTIIDPSSHHTTLIMVYVTAPESYEYVTSAQGEKGVGAEVSNWKAMYYTGDTFYALQKDVDGYGYDVDGNPYFGAVYKLNEGPGNINTTVFYQYYLTPGTINDAVLGYSVEFYGTINIQDFVKGLTTGAVKIEIRKNDTVLKTYNLGSENLYIDVEDIEVSKGDMIYFIVSSEEPSYDIRVYLMPTINYVTRNVLITIDTVEQIELNVDEYDVVQYTITGDYDPSMKVKITILDDSIATIDENNIIHAIKAGETTIKIEVVGFGTKEIKLIVRSLDDTNQGDNSKGCGGSVLASLFGLLTLTGCVFVTKKRKKK